MAVVKFGDIVRDVKINVDRTSNPYEHYVAGDHMDSEDLTLHRYGNFATDDVGPAFTRIFKPEQVLYGSRRTYLKKIVVANFEGICANTTFVLESKDDSLFDNRLLPFIMLSDAFTRWSIAHSKGSTNPYVLFSDLADYEFDLPPIAEQRVIADKLWAAYRLKESYKKLLSATDEMVKSRFIEMFGTIDEPKVEVKKLIDVVLSSGKYGSNTSATDYQEGKPRYIRITDINDDGSLNDDMKTAEVIEDKYKLIPGDIVFARTGATVGKTYMHETGNAIYAGYLIKYQMDESKMKPAFMKAFTHSKTYYNWVANTQKVGAQPNISAAQYDNMPVLVPQIEKQEEFLNIYYQADKSKFVGFKSRFIEMFGECQRKEKLSSLCETFIDGDWIESKDQSEDGIRLVQTGNVGYGYFKDKEDKSRYISEETFNRLHCTEIFAGDILVSRLPAPIGRACIIPAGIGRMITAVDCSIIRLKDIILQEYFISYTMTSTYSAQINEVTTGTTRRRVSRANLGNVLVPCPSLEAQRQFVAISQQADKSKYYYQIA